MEGLAHYVFVQFQQMPTYYIHPIPMCITIHKPIYVNKNITSQDLASQLVLLLNKCDTADMP